MRITDLKITNYRAFYGEHHICLDRDSKHRSIDTLEKEVAKLKVELAAKKKLLSIYEIN